MDTRLRVLERTVAAGDTTAIPALLREQERVGEITTVGHTLFPSITARYDDITEALWRCARGSYQRGLIEGTEDWLGRGLRGEAARWGRRYRSSRDNLLERINIALEPWGMWAIPNALCNGVLTVRTFDLGQIIWPVGAAEEAARNAAEEDAAQRERERQQALRDLDDHESEMVQATRIGAWDVVGAMLADENMNDFWERFDREREDEREDDDDEGEDFLWH